MSVDEKQNEMNKALFSSLIMMLSSSAMQQLGKIVNPMTNKSEVNLEMAQMTIDMIAMLKAKTESNLDDDEDKMLTDILSSLQMNYVETAAAQKNATPEEQSEEQSPAPENKDTETAEEKEEVAGDKEKEASEPKFHKSYGE